MSDDMIQVRIDRLKEDLNRILAANACHAAEIAKVITNMTDRMEVLEEDFRKNFSEMD